MSLLDILKRNTRKASEHTPATRGDLRELAKRIEEMDQAEQAAFDAANVKMDALTGAVVTLVTTVQTEAQQLKDALAAAAAGNDSAGVVAAATALSAKLDSALATAQGALSSVGAVPVAPAVPATPAAP